MESKAACAHFEVTETPSFRMYVSKSLAPKSSPKNRSRI